MSSSRVSFNFISFYFLPLWQCFTAGSQYQGPILLWLQFTLHPSSWPDLCSPSLTDLDSILKEAISKTRNLLSLSSKSDSGSNSIAMSSQSQQVKRIASSRLPSSTSTTGPSIRTTSDSIPDSESQLDAVTTASKTGPHFTTNSGVRPLMFHSVFQPESSATKGDGRR